MLSRFAHLLLAVALLGATGTHWVMLQSVAWATMLADHARTEPLPIAIEKTFDGRHPCALCKQIARGRQTEGKKDQQNDLKKLEFFNQSIVFIIQAPSHFVTLEESSAAFPLLANSPPVPPPRNLRG